MNQIYFHHFNQTVTKILSTIIPIQTNETAKHKNDFVALQQLASMKTLWSEHSAHGIHDSDWKVVAVSIKMSPVIEKKKPARLSANVIFV